jgi:hypothetical protein
MCTMQLSSIMLGVALAVTALGCSTDPGTSASATDDEIGERNAHANTASPRLADKWIDVARGRTIVAVAGANAGSQMREWLSKGWGTEDQPFRRVQSLEAATALHEIAGNEDPVLYGWGWGAEDTQRTYHYRAISGKRYALRFIATDVVATGFGDLRGFLEANAKKDAEALERALKTHAELAEKPLMIVGCSWGGAVVDYGKTRTTSRAQPSVEQPAILGDVPTMAIAGPMDLPTNMQPWPFIGMSHDGDYGSLLVYRRPDDAVGQGGLRPLISRFAGPTHNYTMYWHEENGERAAGGFWGISGAGMLCPAARGSEWDDCPYEE